MVYPLEYISPRYHGLDQWETADIIQSLWEGQLAAASSCHAALQSVSSAVTQAEKRLKAGIGRLIYCGAGSAGFVAALDALDLKATFSWSEERLAILLPSGMDISQGLKSEFEDDILLGKKHAECLNIGQNDVFIGVSASGSSPYTVSALELAREQGALTIAVSSNATSALMHVADAAILTETGAEVIAGSTRLGAGTAQKIILNLFSTALMVRLGYVYDNLMIAVIPENAKLQKRCITIIRKITGCREEEAVSAFRSHGDIKRTVMALAGVPEDEIKARLSASEQNLRKALLAFREEELTKV